MTAIGIDTHKDSLAACAVDGLGAVLGEASFVNDPAGHADLAAWAARVAPGAKLGFEGSSTYGAAAARTGVGPLTAAALVAGTGDPGRFRSPDAFAMLAGVAPIPASSGQTQRMRLNRGGNRQLNRALHVIALVQSRCHLPAKTYIARKIAEGKSWRDAIRCLKRQLVRTVFGLLVEGSRQVRAAA